MNKKGGTIVDLFELDKLPKEKAAEIVDTVGKLIFQAVLARALPTLSGADLAEYNKLLLEKDGGKAVFKFLGEKIPDFENIVKEESETLRKKLASEFKKAGV